MLNVDVAFAVHLLDGRLDLRAGRDALFPHLCLHVRLKTAQDPAL